jgi:hypothetical protein
MPLPNDVSRCLGEKKITDEMNGICLHRKSCASYVQRNTGGERTPITTMICRPHGMDMYIRQEGKDD